MGGWAHRRPKWACSPAHAEWRCTAGPIRQRGRLHEWKQGSPHNETEGIYCRSAFTSPFVSLIFPPPSTLRWVHVKRTCVGSGQNLQLPCFPSTHPTAQSPKTPQKGSAVVPPRPTHTSVGPSSEKSSSFRRAAVCPNPGTCSVSEKISQVHSCTVIRCDRGTAIGIYKKRKPNSRHRHRFPSRCLALDKHRACGSARSTRARRTLTFCRNRPCKIPPSSPTDRREGEREGEREISASFPPEAFRGRPMRFVPPNTRKNPRTAPRPMQVQILLPGSM